ncbi:aminoglycoside phosphotransferase family protein [Candidatus Poribacteria bacterium]|nr:aminoglycoside phosphotransferase family protein [Candidatus Poribacteria bacterium]
MVPVLKKLIDIGHARQEDILLRLESIEEYIRATPYLHTKYTAWKFFLGWNERNLAVHFESRLGMGSLSLSSDFARVICICPNEEERRYASGRFERMGRRNIQSLVIGEPWGDGEKIDAISLEMIDRFMERCPAGYKGVDGTLLACLDRLSPSGTLFVSSLPAWGGRRLAVACGLRSIRKRIEGAMLPTASKYRGKVTFYPSVENWNRIAGYSGPKMSHLRLRRNGGRIRFFIASRLLGGVGGGVGFVYGNHLAGGDFLSLLAEGVQKKTGIDKAEIFEIRLCNPSVLLLKLRSFPSGFMVARVPMHRNSEVRVENACISAIRLHRMEWAGKEAIPQSLGKFSLGGYRVFLEEGKDGNIVDSPKKISSGVVHAAVQWLIDLHQRTASYCGAEDLPIKKYVTDSLDTLNSLLPEEDGERICRIREFMCARLCKGRIPKVFMHGDYKVENILFDDKFRKIRAVIDWDLASEDGWPIVDLLYFIVYNEIMRTNRSSDSILASIFESAEFWRRNECLALSYCQAIDIDPSDFFLFLILFWVHHIMERYSSDSRYLREWRLHQSTVVKKIENILSDPRRFPVRSLLPGV